jgi:hypothetical protein
VCVCLLVISEFSLALNVSFYVVHLEEKLHHLLGSEFVHCKLVVLVWKFVEELLKIYFENYFHDLQVVSSNLIKFENFSHCRAGVNFYQNF